MFKPTTTSANEENNTHEQEVVIYIQCDRDMESAEVSVDPTSANTDTDEVAAADDDEAEAKADALSSSNQPQSGCFSSKKKMVVCGFAALGVAVGIVGAAGASSSASVHSSTQQMQKSQAAIKIKENSGSKSNKSKCGKKCKDEDEEPDGEAVRAKLKGTITLENLVCGSEDEKTARVQVQNALTAALEEIICTNLKLPLIQPCWVTVEPKCDMDEDEVGRRRLDLQSLWTYIASITIAGPATEDTIVASSTAISDVAVALADAVGETIDIILDKVTKALNILGIVLSLNPYEWVAVIPNVPGYQLVGQGYCKTFNGDFYGAVLYEGIPTAQDCAAKCKDSKSCIAEHGWTLVGFEFEGNVDPRFQDCWCDIDEGATADDSLTCSDGGDLDEINYDVGTGEPWFSGGDCTNCATEVICFKLI